MRTRNALTRLAAAAPQTESLVDAAEEDRILARILASPRHTARPRRPVVVVLAGAVVLAAAAVVAATQLGHGGHHVALTGAKLQMAGYHFRTPAGFTASNASCDQPLAPGSPTAVLNGFAAAASADGGCVEAFFMISMNGSAVPSDATPVGVGAYQGYIEAADSSGRMKLYVELPVPSGADVKWQALVLSSQDLTSDQLVAIAESGLPATPSATVG